VHIFGGFTLIQRSKKNNFVKFQIQYFKRDPIIAASALLTISSSSPIIYTCHQDTDHTVSTRQSPTIPHFTLPNHNWEHHVMQQQQQ
jgi:hypothetical protein